MSQIIATPQDCCNKCPTPVSTTIPGEQGATGAAGAAGTNGTPAYTQAANLFPAAQPVMPAEGDSVTVTTNSSTTFLAVGEPVFVENWGTLKVTAIPTLASVTLLNLADTPTNKYPNNAAPGTSLAALSKIVGSGFNGANGAAATGAPTTASYITRTSDAGLSNEFAMGGLATGIVKNTTTTGVPSIAANGTDYYGPATPIDVPITDGGTGSSTAAGARTNLGLGTMSTQASTAVAITGGTINGTIIGGTVSANATVNVLVAGSVETGGFVDLSTNFFTRTGVIQTLSAGTTVNPLTCKVRVAGNAGAVTLTATPTITNPTVDGQHLFIMGTHDTNTVTFQSEASLAGAKLHLGAATRVLGRGDILHLMWDLVELLWFEVSFVNNN